MAYTNPKPTLRDEESVTKIQQDEISAAQYTLMENVYFVFIDVLGFKHEFDENIKNPDNEFASAFKETFQYFSLLMNNAQFTKTENHWNAGQTSDSLYFYTDRVDYLAAFIKIYSHFILFAMSKNVFLRGGISKGNLFVDKPYQFYGDCVTKAYLIENTIAKYPRVVIDHNTCTDLQEEGTAEGFLMRKQHPERSYINPFAQVSDIELQTFLRISQTELYKITEETWTNIRNNIQINLTRFETDDKNYQKYVFLQKILDNQEKPE